MTLDRLIFSQNWNIGFCEETPAELVHSRKLKSIQWMKHPYRDRFFADPFILEVTENTIIVFVEECLFDNPKGIICELHIDKKTKRLLRRYVLLELETHLSYPAWFSMGGKVYVYPENGRSGGLIVYEYDRMSHRLVPIRKILEEPVADATIARINGGYYMVATVYPDTLSPSFLFTSPSPVAPFVRARISHFQDSLKYSRPAGNFFEVDGRLFRPAQDCSRVYGGAISIMEVDKENLTEKFCFQLRPFSKRYSLGMHTLNFYDSRGESVCVVDGCGYLFHIFARVYYLPWFHRVVKKIQGLFR